MRLQLCYVKFRGVLRERKRERALAEARGRGSRPRDRRATPARVQPGGSVNFLTILCVSAPRGIRGIRSHRAAKLLLPPATPILHADLSGSIGREISNIDFTTDRTSIFKRYNYARTFELEFESLFPEVR